MSNDALDIAVARYVREIQLATAEQIASAMQIQAQSAEHGVAMSLSDALVRAGALTPEQKTAIEKKAASEKGVQQLGPFRLIRKLGEGAMGAVYLASEVPDGRKVALKILPKKFASNPEFVKRFKREARAALSLNHPHVVAGFSLGEDLGYHYLAMEYVEGEPLDQVLKRDRFLEIDRAIEIVIQVARGLEHAHAHDIIHRDIKPSNILLSRDGKAKILDLGLSKNLAAHEDSFRTVSGAILGTPQYLSPEQAEGGASIDRRTDLYSLGATFYHLVSGEPPYKGESVMALLTQHMLGQIPNPRDLREDIPDIVVDVIRRMMAKAPGDRYAGCAELIADLKEVAQGKPPRSGQIEASRSTVATLRRRTPTRRSRPPTVRRVAVRRARPGAGVLLGAGAAGAAIILLILIAFSSEKEPSPHPTAMKDPIPVPPAKANPAGTEAASRAAIRLAEVQQLEKSGRFSAEEIRRRYGDFAKEYAGTPEGSSIAEWLEATAPKPQPVAPSEPAVKRPPPEATTVPEPLPPEPRPVTLPPTKPAPKPPAPPPSPPDPMSQIWNVVMQNPEKVEGKPVPMAKPGFEGAVFKVKKVGEKELVVLMTPAGGGEFETREKREALDPAVLEQLARMAAGTLTPEVKDALDRLKEDWRRKANAAEIAKRIKEAGGLIRRMNYARAAAVLEQALKESPGQEEATRLLAEARKHLGPAPTLTLDLGGGATMDLVYIPPGTFVRGGTDPPRYDWQIDDRPRHEVILSRGFYLGATEVTRGQFEAFANASGHETEAERSGSLRGWTDNRWDKLEGRSWRNPNFPQTNDHPVVGVGWEDARAFCVWAAKRVGREVRLPTEAEWEYACRAGTRTIWPCGDDADDLEAYAWMDDEANRRTHPVRGKQPNSWGLYDMIGNVWEWCEDWGASYPSNGVTDPRGPSSGEERCLRGGGWNYGPKACRPEIRRTHRPTTSYTHTGFRVAVTASPR